MTGSPEQNRKLPIGDPERVDVTDDPRTKSSTQAAQPRAVGSPLPRGTSRTAGRPTEPSDAQMTPPNRALAGPANSSDPEPRSSGMQRAIHAVRTAMPFVQRMLPLLDGNVAGAISNVLTPQPKPAPPINLAPIEEGVAALQTQHRELRDKVAEHHTSLKRVEDRLEMVREATDRNTLEQQELMENLKSVGKKVNIVASVALALLLISIILNLVLYLHIQHIVP